MEGLQMKYFVLKPEGDSPYAKASRAAMSRYARSIQDENPELSKSLRRWVANEIASEEFKPICDALDDDGQGR